MNSLRLFLPMILLLSIFLSACTEQEEALDEGPEMNESLLTIYTTVYPLQYFTQKIGGEYAEVHSIYPPGADAHTFEPSQKDMIHLAEADLFFFIGLGLEGFVDKAKKTLQDQKVTLVAAGEHLEFDSHSNHHNDDETAVDNDTEHAHGDIDPHVWIDPHHAIGLAQSILQSLTEQLPEQQTYFEENFAVLEQHLLALDQEFTDALKDAKQTEFIVSHAAYGYWEKRYGIKQINIAGISSSSEPSQKQLEQLIRTAENKEIKYVLVEQNVSPRLANIVKKEIDGETLPIHNLGVLTNKDIESGDNYFTLMSKNIATIKQALQ